MKKCHPGIASGLQFGSFYPYSKSLYPKIQCGKVCFQYFSIFFHIFLLASCSFDVWPSRSVPSAVTWAGSQTKILAGADQMET